MEVEQEKANDESSSCDQQQQLHREKTPTVQFDLGDDTLDGFPPEEENTMLTCVNDDVEDGSLSRDGLTTSNDTKQESRQKTTTDENSKTTATATKRRRRASQFDVDIIIQASQLFVYKWPQDDPVADLWVLQEQISDYLDVKSFKRKYPDLYRRQIDIKEREYLKDNKVVTETQCDLGLNALKLSEVLLIMTEKYPEKYKEFNDYLNEKRKLQAANAPSRRKTEPIKATKQMDANKIKELTKKAIKAASDYNAQLQRERRDERKTFFDLQTMRIQVPKTRTYPIKIAETKSNPYPVSLLSGQYQNYYKKYTSDELKYFPIHTTLYAVPTPDPIMYSEWKQNVKSGDFNGDRNSSDEDCIEESIQHQPVNQIAIPPAIKPETVSKICYVCQKTSFIETMIHCSSCPHYSHPACLELNPSLVDWSCIRNYSWQCMECKVCSTCNEPHDEDKMMFCDRCDRGFHTFCVGVKEVPSGSWICVRCKDPNAALKSRFSASPMSGKRGRPAGSLNKKKYLDYDFNDSLELTPTKRARGRPPGRPPKISISQVYGESNSNDYSYYQNEYSMDYDDIE